jgi:hypothetical protein
VEAGKLFYIWYDSPMINKIKKYTSFFAATLNIVASAFFADAATKQWSDPNNVSSAVGFWFFAASLLLWAVYAVAYFVGASMKKAN